MKNRVRKEGGRYRADACAGGGGGIMRREGKVNSERIFAEGEYYKRLKDCYTPRGRSAFTAPVTAGRSYHRKEP